MCSVSVANPVPVGAKGEYKTAFFVKIQLSTLAVLVKVSVSHSLYREFNPAAFVSICNVVCHILAQNINFDRQLGQFLPAAKPRRSIRALFLHHLRLKPGCYLNLSRSSKCYLDLSMKFQMPLIIFFTYDKKKPEFSLLSMSSKKQWLPQVY